MLSMLLKLDEDSNAAGTSLHYMINAHARDLERHENLVMVVMAGWNLGRWVKEEWLLCLKAHFWFVSAFVSIYR